MSHDPSIDYDRHEKQQAEAQEHVEQLREGRAALFRDIVMTQTITESMGDWMADTLEYSTGPNIREVFAALVRSAKAGDAESIALIGRMAEVHGREA